MFASLLSVQYKSTLELLRHIKWVASNLNMIPQMSTRFEKTVAFNASESASSLTCFNCRESGHKSIDCPKPPRKERCGRCLKVGHATDKCSAAAYHPKQKQPFQLGTNATG